MIKEHLKGGNMYLNKSPNIIMSSTSSFVTYADYTSTSAGNYSNILRLVTNSLVIVNQPNSETMHAISEARNHENLKSYDNVDEFFTDLEK